MPARGVPAVDPAAALRERAQHLTSTQPLPAIARQLVRDHRCPLSLVDLPPLRLASARAPSPHPDRVRHPPHPLAPIRLPTGPPVPRLNADFRVSATRCPGN